MLDKYMAGKGEVANLTISTIHSSKGMEYSHVTIADDFININSELPVEYQVGQMWEDRDLRCLLYVAITRSMVSCTLPDY